MCLQPRLRRESPFSLPQAIKVLHSRPVTARRGLEPRRTPRAIRWSLAWAGPSFMQRITALVSLLRSRRAIRTRVRSRERTKARSRGTSRREPQIQTILVQRAEASACFSTNLHIKKPHYPAASNALCPTSLTVRQYCTGYSCVGACWVLQFPAFATHRILPTAGFSSAAPARDRLSGPE